MKHAHTLLTLTILGLLLVPSLHAQEADSLLLNAKALMETGFNQNNLDQLHTARAMAERATHDEHRAALAHYYVALADYRLANLLAADDEDQAVDRLNNAVDHLKKAIELDDASAEAYALLSSTYGRKIGLQPIKGMFLGPQAGNALDEATKRAPENPRVVLTEAISDFNTPGMFGGDKERALEGFQRAIELFEQETPSDPLLPDWGHEEAYAWLGIAHMNAERYDEARAALEQALVVNPDFGWVKYVLLPQLEKAEGS